MLAASSACAGPSGAELPAGEEDSDEDLLGGEPPVKAAKMHGQQQLGQPGVQLAPIDGAAIIAAMKSSLSTLSAHLGGNIDAVGNQVVTCAASVVSLEGKFKMLVDRASSTETTVKELARRWT